MRYNQSVKVAIIKQLVGWIVMLIAMLHCLIAILLFLQQQLEQRGANFAVVGDFLHFLLAQLRNATPYLELVWQHAPIPNPGQQHDVIFWALYLGIFVGYALIGAGQRMWRQSRYIEEKLQANLLVEQGMGKQTVSLKQQLASIDVINYSLFSQRYRLYVLPIILAGGLILLAYWLQHL